MIQYKNISFSAKTFYGVRFEPGEIKSVPGYINSRGMVRILDSESKSKSDKPRFSDDPTRVSTRGRKKKSSEPEKDSVAENTEIKIETQEETTNGNPS